MTNYYYFFYFCFVVLSDSLKLPLPGMHLGPFSNKLTTIPVYSYNK